MTEDPGYVELRDLLIAELSLALIEAQDGQEQDIDRLSAALAALVAERAHEARRVSWTCSEN